MRASCDWRSSVSLVTGFSQWFVSNYRVTYFRIQSRQLFALSNSALFCFTYENLFFSDFVTDLTAFEKVYSLPEKFLGIAKSNLLFFQDFIIIKTLP